MEEALQAAVRIQPDSQQLNLFDFSMLTEAEQIASIDQAESVPAPFAFPVAQSDIDHILRTGDNTKHHRQIIVSEFSKGKPPEQLIPLLKEVYHGGNGIVTEHGRISAWYGEDGIHFSKGNVSRYVNTAHIVPWKDVAVRIYELLDEGNFATNLEIAEAPSLERHNIADYLCYITRDLSDAGKEAGYLPSLRAVRGGGFPDDVARIEELLADPEQYPVIADEVSTFYAAYKADRELMRFRLPYIAECVAAVAEYAMPRRDYASQMIEVPAVGRFITDDEIDSVIEGGQGSYAGGALRIYQFFQEKHTDAERADFLKSTCGIGGYMPGVSGAFHSSEDHDTKGIKLKKADCEPVMLKWNKVAKRVERMIQQGCYLTPDQQAEMEAIRDAHDEPTLVTPDDEPIDVDYVREQLAERGIVNGEIVDEEAFQADSFTQEIQALSERFAEEEPDVPEEPHQETPPRGIEVAAAPIVDTPYHVGDILYLDDRPFEVESIGKFDVHLRDPNATYPILRAESKERLASLLTLDRRNAAYVHAGESSVRSETVAVYSAEDNNLPYDVVV